MSTNPTPVDLKPCPFCQSRNVKTQSETEEWNISQVRCRACGAIGPWVDIDEYAGGMTWEAEKAAERKWNTRPPASAAPVEPSIFDLLEPLSAALIERGGPDIRYGFARATGGVDIPFIVEAIAPARQQSSDMVERVARAIGFAESYSINGHLDDVLNDTEIRAAARAALEACRHAKLVDALKRLFARYKELADSGDADFWSLEETPEGKLALAVLAEIEA